MKIEFETHLLVTNKGGNLRCINPEDKTSIPIDRYVLDKFGSDITYLGSKELDDYAPWYYENVKNMYGDNFKLSNNVKKNGDGSIAEQMKYAKKFKITIEEI